MLDGIAERLDAVTRDFTDFLDLGSYDAAFVPPPGARVAQIGRASCRERVLTGV